VNEEVYREVAAAGVVDADSRFLARLRRLGMTNLMAMYNRG
jgi:hypothetical protein